MLEWGVNTGYRKTQNGNESVILQGGTNRRPYSPFFLHTRQQYPAQQEESPREREKFRETARTTYVEGV